MIIKKFCLSPYKYSQKIIQKSFKPFDKCIANCPGCSSTGNNRWVLQTAHIPIYCQLCLFFFNQFWYKSTCFILIILIIATIFKNQTHLRQLEIITSLNSMHIRHQNFFWHYIFLIVGGNAIPIALNML